MELVERHFPTGPLICLAARTPDRLRATGDASADCRPAVGRLQERFIVTANRLRSVLLRRGKKCHSNMRRSVMGDAGGFVLTFCYDTTYC